MLRSVGGSLCFATPLAGNVPGLFVCCRGGEGRVRSPYLIAYRCSLFHPVCAGQITGSYTIAGPDNAGFDDANRILYLYVDNGSEVELLAVNVDQGAIFVCQRTSFFRVVLMSCTIFLRCLRVVLLLFTRLLCRHVRDCCVHPWFLRGSDHDCVLQCLSAARGRWANKRRYYTRRSVLLRSAG